MILGIVTGNLWATKKDDGLSGYKLMVVEIINSQEEKLEQEIIAVDTVGAGIGDKVIITRGSSARNLRGETIGSPIDAAIVGIVDSVD